MATSPENPEAANHMHGRKTIRAAFAAVRAKMRERYGRQVPLDEPVISPGAQFASPLLKTVETR